MEPLHELPDAPLLPRQLVEGARGDSIQFSFSVPGHAPTSAGQFPLQRFEIFSLSIQIFGGLLVGEPAVLQRLADAVQDGPLLFR